MKKVVIMALITGAAGYLVARVVPRITKPPLGASHIDRLLSPLRQAIRANNYPATQAAFADLSRQGVSYQEAIRHPLNPERTDIGITIGDAWDCMIRPSADKNFEQYFEPLGIEGPSTP